MDTKWCFFKKLLAPAFLGYSSKIVLEVEIEIIHPVQLHTITLRNDEYRILAVHTHTK